MSYRDDAARLARALADLLTTDQTAPAPPPPEQVPTQQVPAAQVPAEQLPAALVCRDTVVGAVRDLTGALLRATPPPVRAAPDLLMRSPTHALHAALQDLRPVTQGELTLTDALAAAGSAPVALWQQAARAAVALERHHDDAAALPGPAAWSVARDLAALGSALTVLDADLAATVDTAAGAAGTAGAATDTFPHVVAALLDEPAHALLQLAAAEVAAHTADVPFAATALPGRPQRHVQPVRRLADLPAAGQQLAELLRSRGSQLTVVEVRAALRAVTYGVDLTARALTAWPAAPTVLDEGDAQFRGAPPSQPGDANRAVEQLQQALPDLQHLLHSPLATLTPPAPGVLLLSQQLQTRLTAAGRLHDQLQSHAAPAAPRAALNQALARWAVTAAPVVDAAAEGLRAAAASRALLVPRQDPTPARYGPLLWLPPTAGDTHGRQALQAADRAGAALRGAAQPLTTLLGPAADGPSRATRRAAADASAAFAELTAALQTRPAPRHPNPARTPHPSLPGDASRRHLPRR